jgi:S-adenosylmethionine:tRNA ribosyltransferase-isomerase
MVALMASIGTTSPEPIAHRTVIASNPEPIAAPLPLTFDLDSEHEAHEPPEARGVDRDDVRLLVSRGLDDPFHTTFRSFPELLVPGDLVVVNNSPTMAAAIDVHIDGVGPAVVHVSTRLPGDLWMVEPRRRIANGSTVPLTLDQRPATVRLPATGVQFLHLLQPSPGSVRLWLAAAADCIDVGDQLTAHGRPIRYRYVPEDWPIDAYQTAFSDGGGPFADRWGSAEMPSAARPFTTSIVTRLVRRGIGVVPITLHTGVSSLEGRERPYAEHYRVPAATAEAINATRRTGGHVIAIGTTVVRSLETVTDQAGTVHPGDGWTDVVITPERRLRSVDGLLTGWHEPEATHLAMLEAVAGRESLVLAYEAAFTEGYLWHEFGDSHLILPYAGRR